VRVTLSECRRFVVVDAIHVDREVFETLAAWAVERDLGIQDALQLALCAFNDSTQSAGLSQDAEGALSSESRDSPLLSRIE
jgi:hypothetical protein